MSEAIGRRVPSRPRVGTARRAELALALLAAHGDDEREIVDARRAIARLVNEAAVLGVGHELHADLELVEVHAVRRSLVGWAIV